jgi:hypothetical protein
MRRHGVKAGWTPESSNEQRMIDDVDGLLLEIARRTLGIATLETRNSDRLDFKEVAVWSLKDALREAFEAGRRSAGQNVVDSVDEENR